MKCDIHRQKNAHLKTSDTESDGVQQFQFQTSQIFPQYNQVWNVYELVMCGERKKKARRQSNQTMISYSVITMQTYD